MSICPPLPHPAFDVLFSFQRHSAVCTGPKEWALYPLSSHRCFQAVRGEKPQFLPLLGLMIGKGTSKSVPCTFQFRSGTSNPRVKLKICHVYLLSASQNHLKTRRVLRRGFHRKLKLLNLICYRRPEAGLRQLSSMPLCVTRWVWGGLQLKCSDKFSFRLEPRLGATGLFPPRGCVPQSHMFAQTAVPTVGSCMSLHTLLRVRM